MKRRSTRGKILIVDDEEVIRESTSILLKALGYEFEAAEDGMEAVRLLTRGKYSALITDMIMPEMNGLELIKKTRQIRPKIPIIAITGAEREFPYKMVMGAGADEYLGKPFGIKELKGKVEKVLKGNKNKWNDGIVE